MPTSLLCWEVEKAPGSILTVSCYLQVTDSSAVSLFWFWTRSNRVAPALRRHNASRPPRERVPLQR